jgi:hypothetical protein
MPTLLKNHYYFNRHKKSEYIQEILPTQNIEVSGYMFDQFQDMTEAPRVQTDDRDSTNYKRVIEENTGVADE